MSQYKHKRIFIIGHIGAGKALVAKTVADKLGWQFIDADLGIESRVGRSLQEIIGNTGMESFLQNQTDILANQLKLNNIVVATDGNLLLSEENKKLLSSEFVVYLKVSTPIQLERKSRNTSTLMPVSDYSVFLNKLHDDRDGVYEKAASLIIDSDDSELDEHVLHIINTVSESNTLNSFNNEISLDTKDLIMFHKSLHTPVHLSEQQAKCLKLLAQGKSSKEIAKNMNISNRTVEDHIEKLLEDLGCSSSKELIALYHVQPG